MTYQDGSPFRCDICKSTNLKLTDKMWLGKKAGEIGECEDCSYTSEFIMSRIG